MLQQTTRIAIVVANHVTAIARHSVGACAFMEDDRDLVIEIAIGKSIEELLLVAIVCDFAVSEIGELSRALEIVDREDVRLAASVQRPDKIGADESGCAGDHGIHACSFSCSAPRAQKTA